MQPDQVIFFGNGNTAAFVDDKQAYNLQRPWVLCYADHLTKEGIDPAGVKFSFPDRSTWEYFRTSEGELNWRQV